MTTAGSLATGEYTESSVEMAKRDKGFVLGFVATSSLTPIATDVKASEDEDFVVFTTGVNRSDKGDSLGQQYQRPPSAIDRGADFIISGRGVYAVENPVAVIKEYRDEGWKAYLIRTGGN